MEIILQSKFCLVITTDEGKLQAINKEHVEGIEDSRKSNKRGGQN